MISVVRHALASRVVLAAVMLLCGTVCAQTGRAESFSTAQIPLIFPGMDMQGTEEAKYEVPEGGERVELRAPGGERIEALFCPAATAAGDDAAHRPTVIYFYGNAQCIAYALPQVDLFRRCGANVLVADYLGYGLSEGRPSETGCYATADALYEYALSRKDVDRTKLVSAGWSLGAAVAIDLASRKQMAGLITYSGYTSKRELAKRQFPDVPPSAIEHPFLSIDKIGKITCPTLIVHGRRDTLVPFEMSEQLRRASAGKPVEYLPIDGAGHNDLFRVGAEQIRDAVAEFLDRLTNQPASRQAKDVR